ncbi:ABC branched-chain amino acid transporter, permease component (plasmid) [Rhodococcus jostii RHA1]|uniref:ABC branched-chain amino acid transporter, permease component n=2 Tax=Rhodococcus jostii TaxID=132919 RepID=Q0RXF2_RHOJR|nr:ABC branched-chain amino acid transporter, permease component [Rhodococcus jostii RHA1]
MYGAVQAAKNVSFEVYPGEIVGLIGPNGAGKTTVIDAISGFAPSTGTVFLEGVDLTCEAAYKRSRSGMGRSFQDVELYDDLSVAENVTVGATRSRSDVAVTQRVRQVLATVGLGDSADAEVATLSQGRRQLVSVARVLAAGPTVALLDEPAAGLDTTESRWLGERLRDACNSGTSILLVDHDMELVLTICDRVIVLDLGEMIASGPPAVIRADDKVISAYLGLPAGEVDNDAGAIPELHAPSTDTQEVLR